LVVVDEPGAEPKGQVYGVGGGGTTRAGQTVRGGSARGPTYRPAGASRGFNTIVHNTIVDNTIVHNAIFDNAIILHTIFDYAVSGVSEPGQACAQAQAAGIG
jgi:hypothetical protein